MKNKTSNYLMLIGFSFLILSYLVPILTIIRPTFYKEILATLAIAFFSLSIKPKINIKYGLFGFLLMIIPFLYYKQEVVYYFYDAWGASSYILMCFLMVGVGFYASKYNANNIDLFWKTIFLIAFLSSLIAIRQRLGWANTDFEIIKQLKRPYANLGQPNHLATLMWFGICSVLYFYEKRILNTYLSVTICLMFIFTAVLTLSRTFWFIFVFSIILFNFKIDENSKKHYKKVICLLFFYFILFVFLMEPLSVIVDKSTTVNMADRVSADGRVNIWLGSLQAIMNGPWYGYGFGQIQEAQLNSNVVEYRSYFNYSHNILLDIILWAGPWVGSMIILLLGRAMFLILKNSKNIPAVLAIFGFLIHSMLEYPYAYLYLLIVPTFLFGFVKAEISNVDLIKNKQSDFLFNYINYSLALMLLLAVFVINNEFNLLLSSRHHAEMRHAKVSNLKLIDIESVKFLDIFKEQEQSYALDYNKKLTNKELKLMERSTRRQPKLESLDKLIRHQVVAHDVVGACNSLAIVKKIYGTNKRDYLAGDLEHFQLLQCKNISIK